MEFKSLKKSNLKDPKYSLFGFELNRTQNFIILVVSLMGLFIIPYILAGQIFFNLFQAIFIAIPAYLSDPMHYVDLYLFYAFAPVIWDLIESSLLLYLCIYILRKILKANSNNTMVDRRKTIQQDRTINWLGFRLYSAQAFFIYSLSLVGIIFTVKMLIFTYTFSYMLFEELCYIPDSPTTMTSHILLLENIPIFIISVFFVLCIYSLIVTKRIKSRSSSVNNVQSYRLLIFIPSFIISLFSLIRIFCHLFIFTDLAYALGTTPEPPNLYQFADLANTIVIIAISLIAIKLCYSYKKKFPMNETNSKVLTCFRIKLNTNRVIGLLSLALIYGIFFGYMYLYFTFLFGLRGPQILSYVSFPILFLCGYTIIRLLKNRRFDQFIDSIVKSEELITRWFKYPLNRLYSIIFLSVSSGVGTLLIYQFLTTQMNIQYMILAHSFEFSSAFWFFSLGCMLVSISLIMTLVIYTIKKTLISIKYRE